MLFYIILFSVILLMAVLIYRCNWATNAKNAIFLVLAGVLLIVVSAIRYDVGFDYSYVYAPMYEQVVATGFSNLTESRHEVGFLLLQYITSLLTHNYQALFVVTSILCVGLLFCGFFCYAPNAAVSVLLFLTWGYFFCSMNFIRQFISSGIVLFAIMAVKKRRPIRFIILVLIAAAFHKTALLILPFYFILRITVTKRILLVYGGITAFLLAFSDKLIRFAVSSFFPWYLEESTSFLGSNLSLSTIVMPLVVFTVIFLYRDLLCKQDGSNSIYISAAFFMLFFHVISLKHALLDRFVIFFAPVVMIGLSVLMSQLKEIHLRHNKLAFVVPAIALCIVSVATAASQLSDDGHGVVPYRTVFSQPFFTEYSDSLKLHGVQREDGSFGERGKSFRPNGFADADDGVPDTEPPDVEQHST